MRALTLAPAIALALFACDKPAAPGSCYRPQDNVCLEYGPARGAAGKRLCTGMKWTDGANSCGTAGRLGSCKERDATQLYYSGAPNNYDATSAKSACEHAGGAWSL